MGSQHVNQDKLQIPEKQPNQDRNLARESWIRNVGNLLVGSPTKPTRDGLLLKEHEKMGDKAISSSPIFLALYSVLNWRPVSNDCSELRSSVKNWSGLPQVSLSI